MCLVGIWVLVRVTPGEQIFSSCVGQGCFIFPARCDLVVHGIPHVGLVARGYCGVGGCLHIHDVCVW